MRKTSEGCTGSDIKTCYNEECTISTGTDVLNLEIPETVPHTICDSIYHKAPLRLSSVNSAG